ncbi:hypothetical protein [Jannaschia aquimarina]|uniref:Uncharacterized protein n=1 Tax=Jannaschia aquimarina TaxID=935700 RepID=A0A0D1ECW1_9RHOB|nr:hypothetical protein [Jannaschia aquimarina]KIT15569.1 hypothetical protein jaqu_26660 [Jannaschia aquimarina]SNT27079.1 hypothetical protein SAMN05421775_109120 [Jannaschia aquimarina]
MAADDEVETESGARLVPAGKRPQANDLATILDGRYVTWLTANATWTDLIRDEDAIGTVEYGEVTANLRKARDAASRTPPRCTDDLAALLHIWWDEYGLYLRDDDLDLPDEAHDPAPLFIARMWRAATGLDGWPRQIVGTPEGSP